MSIVFLYAWTGVYSTWRAPISPIYFLLHRTAYITPINTPLAPYTSLNREKERGELPSYTAKHLPLSTVAPLRLHVSHVKHTHTCRYIYRSTQLERSIYLS